MLHKTIQIVVSHFLGPSIGSYVELKPFINKECIVQLIIDFKNVIIVRIKPNILYHSMLSIQ